MNGSQPSLRLSPPPAPRGQPEKLEGSDLLPALQEHRVRVQRRALRTTGQERNRQGLIESQHRHLTRVANSVRGGTISLSTLLKRLRSGSRKNATLSTFREAAA
ncbi:Tn3 family transposase [Streptomyces sp. PmtG]